LCDSLHAAILEHLAAVVLVHVLVNETDLDEAPKPAWRKTTNDSPSPLALELTVPAMPCDIGAEQPEAAKLCVGES
jgi:hypothetical protein